MDLFKQMTAKTIGPGGVKCPCCNVFREKKAKRKIPGLSKLRRSRLKAFDAKINRKILRGLATE